MAAIYTFKILNVFTLKRVSNLGCIRFIMQVLLSNSKSFQNPDLDNKSNRILPFVHLNHLCDARGNDSPTLNLSEEAETLFGNFNVRKILA